MEHIMTWLMTHMTQLLLPLFVLSVVAGAVGDGLYDKGKKLIGKILQHTELATFILLYLFTLKPGDYLTGLIIFASYIGLRFALFDYLYNMTRGLPINYHGSTSFYGRLMNWYKGTKVAKIFVPGPFIAILKLISGVFAVAKLLTL